MVGWLDGWVAGLSKTKTKPNPKLKFGLSFTINHMTGARIRSMNPIMKISC